MMNNLSEFIEEVEGIQRTKDIAEIIYTYNHCGLPIRLIGFSTESGKTDFEIYEEGYNYYNKLTEHINVKNNR